VREQEIICTVCPMGCHIQVTGEGATIEKVTGYGCPRGEKYARSEFVRPVRILTAVVRVENTSEPLLAARTSGPVPKDRLFACMEVIRSSVFQAPIQMHQVLIADLAGTGVDLIASAQREAEKRQE
jgi:CxxC motif-containing protein